MKTANAALLVAAGILLLWVVTSGRLKNLAASWQALLGVAPSGGSSSNGISLPNSSVGTWGGSSSSISLPNSSVGTWGTSALSDLPSIEDLQYLQGSYPEMYPSVVSGVPTFDQSTLG